MPELPEVETIVRDLNKVLLGKVFQEIIVHDAFVLRTPKALFLRSLKGRSIKEITRRGKAILIQLDSKDFLVVQLMMTGQLVMEGLADKHSHVIFLFSDGTKLIYNDQRKFGQLRVVQELTEIKHFNILGPEPFSKDFNPSYIVQYLKKTIRPIKNILLDHTFVAGIGNIYACEILFRARLNPKRPGQQLKALEVQMMYKKILEVFKQAIEQRGSSIRNYRDASGEKGKFNLSLQVYARQGEPCTRCQKPIERIVQSARSTFYCRHCQK